MELLALELKKTCDEKGKELDPANSAGIIYQIGLEHIRIPFDKISLIKGVGLLNAAVVRNPKNVHVIKNKLSKLCKLILKEANAQNQTADLIQQAKHVKSLAEKMRCKADEMLLKPKRSVTKKVIKTLNSTLAIGKQSNFYQENTIESMQKIQAVITEDYKIIMKGLSEFCESVMGPPPCRFAVVGMGSMARKEITPFSDFEHIIILGVEESCESHLEYFRWFSVIFHTVILNLQETLIPSLHVMHLNDETSRLGDWFFDTQKSGMSFDGMMPHACKFPLGRQRHTQNKPWSIELIQPVDKMLKYLTSEANLKNGYHLSDILTATCFVYGDRIEVYEKFEYGIMMHINSKPREETLLEIKKQVEEDLNKFSARFSLNKLQKNDTINVKQLFYRSSTLFVVVLGKIHQITSTSCFDIINDLAEQKLITHNAKKKLLFAVAIACKIRLRVYMKNKSQYNYIELQERSQEKFDDLLEIVGTSAVFNYFQIIYCLQCEVIHLLKFQKKYIYSMPQFINVAICYALKLDRFLYSLLMKGLASPYFGYKIVTVFNGCINFDQALAIVEEQTNCFSDENAENHNLNIEEVYNVLWNLALQLYRKKQYSEAVDFFKAILDICHRQTSNKNTTNKHAIILSTKQNFVFLRMFISLGLLEMNEKENALIYVKQFIEDIKHLFHDFRHISMWYFIAGNIFFKLKEFDDSLYCLQMSLGIFLSLDKRNDAKALKLYSGIASCLLRLKSYEESFVYFKLTIHIFENRQINFSEDVYFDSAFTAMSTYKDFGICLMKLMQHKEALNMLLKADNINISTAEKEETIEDLLNLLRDIAECFLTLGRVEESIHYIQRSLYIRKKSFSKA